jgi:hypothetical protein
MTEHPKISVNLLQAHVEALRAMAALEGEKALSVVVRGLIREAAEQRGLWPPPPNQNVTAIHQENKK